MTLSKTVPLKTVPCLSHGRTRGRAREVTGAGIVRVRMLCGGVGLEPKL